MYPPLAGELKGVENFEILIPPPAPSRGGDKMQKKPYSKNLRF